MAKDSKNAAPIVRLGNARGPFSGLLNREKPRDMRRTVFRLMKHIGKSRSVLISLICCTFVVTGIDVVAPMLQQKAIDTISYGNSALTVDLDKMKQYLLILLMIFLLSAAFAYCQGIFAAKLSQDTVYALRKNLFRKISYLSIQYTDTHSHGDLMSRMTNDVENVSNAVSQSISALLSAIITLAGAFCMMLYYSRLMTVIAVITIPIILLISTKLAKFMQKYYTQQQVLLGELNGQVEEKVTGYRTVVAFSKEKESVECFAEVSEKLRVNSIWARVWGSILGPITNFLGNFQYVLLAGIGGYLMISGKSTMTIGSIQAMLLYSKKLSHPINMITNQYANILTALAGAERIFEILDSPDETNEGKKDFQVEQVKGAIEFQNIRFGYVPGEPVLKTLNLSVKPGQKIAIVGATGSGKTTIVNLLTRFYELDRGSILIDGVNITDIPKDRLRKSIAIVLQDTVLFKDTILANIAFGNPDADEAQVKKAAAMAMADHFIERLPDGYHTELTQSGSNLSAGQRQLLAIARAILAEPRILILDEATSSVDTRTEIQIQQAMANLMKGRTSLIIAHRISTIRDADAIVLVKDGVIAECGNHEELLRLEGNYYNLCKNQYGNVG